MFPSFPASRCSRSLRLLQQTERVADGGLELAPQGVVFRLTDQGEGGERERDGVP